MITLSEVFHSIEGEGMRSGIPTLFVRVKGCPYECPYCDTKYAQKVEVGDNDKAVTPQQLCEIIEGYKDKGSHVEFTGGDPMLYKLDIVDVIRRLPDSYSYTIQAIGDEDLERFFNPFRDRVRFAYDLKDCAETSIPFRVNVDTLREYDEVKIIVNRDNYDRIRDRAISLLQYSKCAVIISSISPSSPSLYDEIKEWRWVTETVLSDMHWPSHMRNRLHILPRLQQLYWRNQHGY